MKAKRLHIDSDPVSHGGLADSPYKVGLIVLSTDLNCERDFSSLRTAYLRQGKFDFDFYVNRIDFDNPITETSLQAMLPRITQCGAQILPGEKLDAIVFNCTSASALLGDLRIEHAIHEIQPDATVITTASAAVGQLQAIGASRISILAPYSRTISQALVDYFEHHGIRVSSMAYLDMHDDRQIARLQEHQIIAAARECFDPESQALFISCTGMPAVPVLGRIGRLIGRPCLSSNYSAFAQTMAALGIPAD